MPYFKTLHLYFKIPGGVWTSDTFTDLFTLYLYMSLCSESHRVSVIALLLRINVIYRTSHIPTVDIIILIRI